MRKPAPVRDLRRPKIPAHDRPEYQPTEDLSSSLSERPSVDSDLDTYSGSGSGAGSHGWSLLESASGSSLDTPAGSSDEPADDSSDLEASASGFFRKTRRPTRRWPHLPASKARTASVLWLHADEPPPPPPVLGTPWSRTPGGRAEKPLTWPEAALAAATAAGTALLALL